MLQRTSLLVVVAAVSLMVGVTLTAGGAEPPDHANDGGVEELEARVAELEALLEGVTRIDDIGATEWTFDGDVNVSNLSASDDVAAGDDIDANDDVFADVDGDGKGQLYGDCATTPIEGCSNFNP